ncbi:hypothetical protein [Pyrobaculum neutrophilum]|uniref:Uncharacterized protein n=1 Tax=Pyrobaculum neutrophilum (strain DSM 2338 / JCM 9278 / NBRC 100436 / V24Sta) TaxID=444157 RepID=B1YE34_PYRNV|nr:hypothetical protein [Pyrobaculum neutrophilum]ACB40047.1 hypothetical protein Tneu_1116 [Pyrobaculum neutrophilum V24Sta]
MQELIHLTAVARDVVYHTLRDVISQWDRLSKSRRRAEARVNKLALSDDVEVHRTYAVVEKRGLESRKVLQDLLSAHPIYGELYEHVVKDAPFQDDLVELLAHQTALALALSPAHHVAEGTCKLCNARLHDAVEYSISDLLEGLITQFVLGRHTVAHLYVYGSSKFRHWLIVGQRQGAVDPEKVHEPTVIKELAPPIYAYLASLNLVSNAIDEKLRGYDILGKLALSRGQEKVIVLMGLGNALAKSLLSGLIYKNLDYLRALFASILLADVLIANVADVLERGSVDVRSVMALAHERYMRYREPIETVLNKHSLKKDKAVIYEVWDAVRDSTIKYMIYAAERQEDELKLSDAISFRIP